MIRCLGCDSKRPLADHYHQYTTLMGTTMSCWYIDNQCFTTVGSARRHLSATYGLTLDESIEFFKKLPKKYN